VRKRGKKKREVRLSVQSKRRGGKKERKTRHARASPVRGKREIPDFFPKKEEGERGGKRKKR